MSYSGASQARTAREALGKALAGLQEDPNIPSDVMAVAENIAKAVSALFEAENASSEVDGKSCIRRALGSLSQTLALLQDVRANHPGIERATQTLAQAMSSLYPLTTVPSVPPGSARQPSAPAPQPTPPPAALDMPAQSVEANIGATTESNFYVGFSGEIAEGGVFVATYNTLPAGTPVQLLVTLPGGYELKADGVVRFVRDPMDFTADSEPGMGVCFQSLSQEQRELALRFIRKRPPMFYEE